jgi:hypothetical protein
LSEAPESVDEANGVCLGKRDHVHDDIRGELAELAVVAAKVVPVSDDVVDRRREY